ncbi:MAG: O-antigen ligase family protein [bacterium]|nr:O-antigen ligase family protein [bacterium]
MINKLLSISFYLLFFLTPLFWTPWNFELFEYNKMMLVYFLTLIIFTSWILKMLKSQSLIFKRTPLDIPLLFFLLANILSTIFSVDTHTSLWGYYSRSNGGLLSIISYTVLYYALVSNFGKEEVMKFLKAALLGGLVVSLYAIPEHFGISPSCVFLTGQFSASCWVQNVQARVFATLGQPNWLAAYLGMLIFPALYFALTAKNTLTRTIYYSLSTIYYLAFTFTYSRGATLGVMAGLAVFLSAMALSTFKSLNLQTIQIRNQFWIKPLAIILGGFLLTNLLFGSSLTRFQLFLQSSKPTVTQVVSGTQLESGGSESGQIRLIVWKGALEIFKHYPIFGSGVETFAYTYYNFRPTEHNLVSEWDFLYNKAHNEFLNYLATTGAVGFLSYLAVIITFLVWSWKQIMSSELKVKAGEGKYALFIQYPILTSAMLASYLSYHVQDFFGFSVVIIAVFFYLFPAIAFITSESTKPLSLNFHLSPAMKNLLYSKITKTFIILFSLWLGWTILQYYRADTIFARGERESEAGNAGVSYNLLTDAVSLNSGEPYYQSELAYAAAASATALAEQDATTSSQLKDQAATLTERVLTQNPKNVSYYRTAVRTYYLLSTMDKNFTNKTLQVLDQTMALAPTDVKLPYNKALILEKSGQTEEAIILLKKALQLKPDYKEAQEALKELKNR